MVDATHVNPIAETSQFDIVPRSDCDADAAKRFTIVSPAGCTLPLRPLNEGQARCIVELLNAFAEEGNE